MLAINNRKIVISHHAKERMRKRVLGNEKNFMNRRYLQVKGPSAKIIFALNHLLGHQYYCKGEDGYSSLFDKGYVEYVLAETPTKITVVTVIFHGPIRGKERIAKLKGENK